MNFLSQFVLPAVKALLFLSVLQDVQDEGTRLGEAGQVPIHHPQQDIHLPIFNRSSTHLRDGPPNLYGTRKRIRLFKTHSTYSSKILCIAGCDSGRNCVRMVSCGTEINQDWTFVKPSGLYPTPSWSTFLLKNTNTNNCLTAGSSANQIAFGGQLTLQPCGNGNSVAQVFKLGSACTIDADCYAYNEINIVDNGYKLYAARNDGAAITYNSPSGPVASNEDYNWGLADAVAYVPPSG